MKKVSLLILLLIIFVGLSSYIVSQDNEEYRDIVLKISIGMVEKGIPEDSDQIYYQRVRPGTILREGEYLKTSDSSNATLQIGEDVVKVEQNTTLKLDYVEDGGTALSILHGAVLTKVSKLTEGGQFNVNSPSAVAGVRGTSFRFSYNRKTTEGSVTVSDGIVEVGNKTVKNKSILLNRNQRISIKKETDPTDAKIETITPDVKGKSAEDLVSEPDEIDADLYDKDFDIDY
jgi:hypothetical protein